ncbi:hypothetical protein PLICRDRAFT_180102 [Plicaturopsis crispa FD-325 SS-3]|uniref:Uncharacterized protein n=1 Tax=Plicaturopsis crispa FD-325 SS-3 TaxID=944288 RepID=A0A0C9SWJ9_PLICR|nr:hypothetical protein PLICRDRAFT_180102 [Plicaturopsis crispa FD-325 SS-3]
MSLENLANSTPHTDRNAPQATAGDEHDPWSPAEICAVVWPPPSAYNHGRAVLRAHARQHAAIAFPPAVLPARIRPDRYPLHTTTARCLGRETTTTKRDAGWRVVVVAFPPPADFLQRQHTVTGPSSRAHPNHHGPAASRAPLARARETATTKRDARRRLVVVAFPTAAAFRLPPPSANQTNTGRPSCALRARARETATMKRDASRRLVVVSPPAGAAFLATLNTLSRARRLVRARRRRRNAFLAAATCLHPQQITTGPPPRAHREPVHARRRRRNETPAGVSSSLPSPPPPPPPSAFLHPQQTTTGRPSCALQARARETATMRRDASRRLVVVAFPPPPPPPVPAQMHPGSRSQRMTTDATSHARTRNNDDGTRRQLAFCCRRFTHHRPPLIPARNVFTPPGRALMHLQLVDGYPQPVDVHHHDHPPTRHRAVCEQLRIAPALSKSYNALCDQLANLIRLGRALPGCVAPTKISRDGLFRLDVDDDIWQDIGLEEDNGDRNGIPLWLGDDQVREGIRARLELDRCLEEEARLSKERCSMQEWMMEEWCVSEGAHEAANDDHDMVY